MKTRRKIKEALEIARRIWVSRTDINDALLPEGLTPEESLAEQVRLAHDDTELNKAFFIYETLEWVLDQDDDENFVEDLLQRYNNAPERTGDYTI